MRREGNQRNFPRQPFRPCFSQVLVRHAVDLYSVPARCSLSLHLTGEGGEAQRSRVASREPKGGVGQPGFQPDYVPAG